MTVADYIRNMDDVRMAHFFQAIISERDKVISEELSLKGIPNSVIEIPSLSILHHLKFLRRPAEDVFTDVEEEES